ncbi:mitochondrial sodium/calcium exchanger protein isoform X3 [Drosophila kikkawai]|uniref:Mitochondrial sodium/calcium exchanger protein isoform X3 n=1 Tax=Drosophila kikkawai TaxID=30033 RepID=A0A6P4IX03_DROKI|nr:mitochondrial sodium/calcium exchanger protein isoform X3 [Drosophila kikkawai]
MRLRTRGSKWNFTQLDYEFENFFMNISCVAVMRLPYSMRCMMAKRAHDCKRIINFFNYFRMMYCYIDIDNKTTEILLMCLFLLICVVFLWVMSYNISTFFAPVLKIVSWKLHMNEYLAGVTFLAFGNSCPDIIANLMPVRADAPIFTIAVGNALAIILLSGGAVCFLRPFKINGHCTVRDLLFLLLGVEVLRYVMVRGGPGTVTMWESIGLIFVYVVYVTVNVIDLVIMRYSMKKLRRELEEMKSLPTIPQNEYAARMGKLTSWEVDDELPIHDTTKYRRSTASGSHFIEATHAGYFVTPKQRDPPETVDVEKNRTYLYNSENPKNLMLFREFLESLNPIDGEAWELGGCCQRFFLIIRSPLVLLLLVFIPVVDFEKDKHGWSKLLNCLQIVLNPFVVITLVHCSRGVQQVPYVVHNPQSQYIHVVTMSDASAGYCDFPPFANGCAALLSPALRLAHLFQFYHNHMDSGHRVGGALRDCGHCL